MLPLRHMKSLGREWGRYFCSRARIYGYARNADSREIRSHGLHVYVIPAHVAGEGEKGGVKLLVLSSLSVPV